LPNTKLARFFKRKTVLRHFKLVGKELLGSSHPRRMKKHHPSNPGLKDMAGSHRHGMESYRTCVEKPATPPPTLAATAEDPTTLSCMVGRVG
jgi:hypothetical protein